MIQIYYKISDEIIKFHSTIYEFDDTSNIHFLSYNEGIVGEENNFETFITEDYSKIEKFLEDIKLKYPDKIIERKKYKLSLFIDEDLKKLSSKRFEDLLNNFMSAAKYASYSSGQWEFNKVVLNHNKNEYFIHIELIDKNLFFELFLYLISFSGLVENDFKII